MAELPWSERVNAISVNPDMANRSDIARMANDIQNMKLLLLDWEKREGDMTLLQTRRLEFLNDAI